MKTVLITGAAGFIGSHLTERLLNDGHRVIGIDNLFTGSKDNLKEASKHPQFTFIEHDIIEEFCSHKKINQIYNLACPASPIHYQENPIYTIKINTIGVINMLELAREKEARILQASTSEIYGDPEEHPQKEEYRGNTSTIGPRACYDEGKRCAETLFYDYHRKYNLEIKIARIFNTYGPRMSLHDGRAVCNFIIQALKKEPVTLYGKGHQTRSFCFVSDLVEGLIRLMEAPGKVTSPINLGNTKEQTMRELAELIIEMCDAKKRFIFSDLPEDDPRRRCPDITKAKILLNWKPRIAIREGLKKTIDYFKERI
ncbi:MAG: NAD-dependent dehydratase [Candidatus Magasanikbacteria bacterium RIFCSPLOWO2_02_FULL_44_11]|uniref:UDP-glucuronate decarboxylase n=2 Tax=Candidatus Magasanikiibacteriota TaxID=1752731 RepID=A0A1F6N9L5_9BACT|nr:MAG: NAD-dependent dehydratase [Candidatus Magasanikbacteria bacterium RIFCSPHIGHO2_02_FULL_45_10]OGH80615.1 MAG: NAD-dependent dehydratase [Candidatus Magasanikbacteria bacterium RIFCSPLOWO2_02_FULL_44_11]